MKPGLEGSKYDVIGKVRTEVSVEGLAPAYLKTPCLLTLCGLRRPSVPRHLMYCDMYSQPTLGDEYYFV